MKPKILKLRTKYLIVLMLCLALFETGCENYENEGEWFQIDSLMPDIPVSLQLSSIFIENENCLIDFQQDTVFKVFYSQQELVDIDTCNIIPEIDFNKYSLIAGKIMVPGMVSNISNITLTYNNSEERYSFELLVDECEECYAAIGFLLFWRLYPKLNIGYDVDVFIDKI